MPDLLIHYIKYGEFIKRGYKEYARKKLYEVYLKVMSYSEAARLCGTHRSVVKRLVERIKKEGEEGFKPRSKKPKNIPNKTPPETEEKIIKLRKETGYGAIRISRIMREKEGIYVGVSAVRYVLKRKGVCHKKKRTKYRTKQRYYDFEKIYPLQNFEIDLKEILDMRALPSSTYQWILKNNFPLYQWTSIDIKTRIRFISYSYEKSFNCGLVFMLNLIYFLRAFGINHKLTFKTDNGEEFGGKSVNKLEYLNKYIFSPLNCTLLHNPKGKWEYNNFVERSHRTDDEEFYIPQIEKCKNLKEFMAKAYMWQFFYNVKRPHMALNKSTPFNKLKYYLCYMSICVCLFPVVILDNLASLYSIYFYENDPSYYPSFVADLPTHYLCFSVLS